MHGRRGVAVCVVAALTACGGADSSSAGESVDRFDSGGAPAVAEPATTAPEAVVDPVIAPTPGAEADTATGQAVFGTLTYVDPVTKERVPVRGAVITVESSDPSVNVTVDPVRSAADGSWRVSVPQESDYLVTLDLATLPSGVFGDPDRNSLRLTIRDGEDSIVVFRLRNRGL